MPIVVIGHGPTVPRAVINKVRRVCEHKIDGFGLKLGQALRLIPKIFLRTLLYSTSARGQVVEAMYVKLCQNGSEQTFSFWGYGETNKLTAGSGLFVGQTGITFCQTFYLFEGHLPKQLEYEIEIIARAWNGCKAR